MHHHVSSLSLLTHDFISTKRTRSTVEYSKTTRIRPNNTIKKSQEVNRIDLKLFSILENRWLILDCLAPRSKHITLLEDFHDPFFLDTRWSAFYTHLKTTNKIVESVSCQCHAVVRIDVFKSWRGRRCQCVSGHRSVSRTLGLNRIGGSVYGNTSWTAISPWFFLGCASQPCSRPQRSTPPFRPKNASRTSCLWTASVWQKAQCSSGRCTGEEQRRSLTNLSPSRKRWKRWPHPSKCPEWWPSQGTWRSSSGASTPQSTSTSSSTLLSHSSAGRNWVVFQRSATRQQPTGLSTSSSHSAYVCRAQLWLLTSASSFSRVCVSSAFSRSSAKTSLSRATAISFAGKYVLSRSW